MLYIKITLGALLVMVVMAYLVYRMRPRYTNWIDHDFERAMGFLTYLRVTWLSQLYVFFLSWAGLFYSFIIFPLE